MIDKEGSVEKSVLPEGRLQKWSIVIDGRLIEGFGPSDLHEARRFARMLQAILSSEGNVALDQIKDSAPHQVVQVPTGGWGYSTIAHEALWDSMPGRIAPTQDKEPLVEEPKSPEEPSTSEENKPTTERKGIYGIVRNRVDLWTDWGSRIARNYLREKRV